MIDWRSAYLEVEGLVRFVVRLETALSILLAPFVILLLPVLFLLAATANRRREGDASTARAGVWERQWGTRI